VQWDELYVRLLDPKTGQLLREHVRQKRGWYRIKEEDRPKRTPLRTSQLLWRAGRAGSHIGALCEAIHHAQGEVGVRRILGVLSLAKKYGAAAVDESLRRRARHGSAGIPLRPPLSGTLPASPTQFAASRSPDPRAGAVPRLHQLQNQGDRRMNLIELESVRFSSPRCSARRAATAGGTCRLPA